MSGVRRTKSRVTIQLESKEKEALSHPRVSCSRVRGQGGGYSQGSKSSELITLWFLGKVGSLQTPLPRPLAFAS